MAKTAEVTSEKKAPAVEQDPWSIKRTVMVPRIPGSKTQPDKIVSVNSRRFQIQRGVAVEVPLPIAEVLERSLRAELDAEDEYYKLAEIKTSAY